MWSYRNNRWLKPRLRGKGYESVVLCNIGEEKAFSVHRLVAEAFLSNPKNFSQVNHKDGDKRNNSLNNLEWCSNAQNVQHAYDSGIREKLSGSKHHNSKSGKLRMPCGDTLLFKCQRDLGREFGLDRTCVSDVLSGKRKSHKGWTRCT